MKLYLNKIKKNNLNFLNYYKYKKLKPTPNFVKKTIFNWIGSLDNLFCLDLFSCTGSLGIEAMLRGCKFSTLLEKNKKNFFFIKNLLKKNNFKNLNLFNCDFFYYIKKINIYFYDVIFIDSPYMILKNLIKFIEFSLKFLKPGSLIYIETIFNVELIFKHFKNKVIIFKNNFFNKINFFLFKIL